MASMITIMPQKIWRLLNPPRVLRRIYAPIAVNGKHTIGNVCDI